MKKIIENVVYQHAENVCSLWLQRQNAVEEPHYSFADIVHLDKRLEANLEGLRVAGTSAHALIDEIANTGDEGAFFTKALLCLEKADQQTFAELITVADTAENPHQVLTELESALAWSQPEFLRDAVKSLLSSEDSNSIILGLKTCVAHIRDPSLYLDRHFNHQDARVRATVINVAADIGKSEYKHRLLSANSGESQHEAFERARALAMFGEQKEARQILGPIARSDSAFNTQATALYVLLDDVAQSRSLLKDLHAMQGRERDVVQGFGLLGDPRAMDWLIEKTSIPELGRLAGGAITMITGIDLAETDLEANQTPDGFEDGGISDDPNDDRVALDQDEDLPWPDPALVNAWWHNSPKLAAGKRFLNGREKHHPELIHVLANGMQRQRNAAAMSLALLQPGARFLDTRLPTNKQIAWMS